MNSASTPSSPRWRGTLLAMLCLPALAAAAGATVAATATENPTPGQSTMSSTTDPYLWLENVDSERALNWVRQRNAESEKQLRAWPAYETLRSSLLEVLDSQQQIPYVTRRGPWLYNFWRDATHPRGLWRRATLAEYRKPEPAWDVVLDLDALARAEGENWVWGGASCLGPEYRKCLLSLSRGGADAKVVREFDAFDKAFVKGGFTLSEAKSTVEWIDADHLYVGTQFGPGSQTESGYPRVIKRWQRGQLLADAEMVFEVQPRDVSADVSVDRTPGFERTLFERSIDFYRSEVSLQKGDRLVLIDKPADAKLHFDKDRLLIRLRSDWTVAGKTWPGGSLLATQAAAYLNGERRFTALFTPTATRSLGGFAVTRRAVLLDVLDNVAGRLEEWTEERDGWHRRQAQAPYPGNLSASALYDPLVADEALDDAYLLNVSDFLRPDSLQLGRVGSDARQTLKQRPTFFDATGMHAEQRFATSRDGTRVPYFVIWPREDAAAKGGPRPTLLYGYGGFEVALTPWYSGAIGRAWTSRGGVFVVANIRGGGEFGPAWHQAAVRENKAHSYEDFEAVAEDLIASGVTRPQQLAIQGGSNGGLLVGAVMVRRPDLFGAVVCQVPLLDMQRYHRLLAGASWMAEYGDPDQPGDWDFIRRYSPYQNVRSGVKMARVLFTTSTRDDRVHPAHARKMAARMLEQGHPLLYWENIEGGHGGAADNAQRATMMALEYSFLWQQLTAAPAATR